MGGEFTFIEGLQRQCRVRPPVTLGIGDDAAIVQWPGPTTELVTTDMLMEGVDFLMETATPAEMGRKSLAVNLSDLAAMGARPTMAYVSLALPRQRGLAFAEELYAGLLQLADSYDVTIAGGDTNSWDGPLVVSVTAMGVPYGASPVRRSGAMPGDRIWVTGACGGSLAGRHLTFEPRLREVSRLLELVALHALIDISDGLSADLAHILDASGVGAVVDAGAIPIHADVALLPPEKSPLARALSDGEDFELIFCVSPSDADRLRAAWDLPTPITEIGQIVSGSGAQLRHANGDIVPLPPQGWTHSLG